MSLSKPKHSGVRDPNKHENNIQHLRYYRNKYNRDKNKTKNSYRSNTGHGGEPQGYNRNARQDNPNNVITCQQTNSNHQNTELQEIGYTLVEVLTSINCRTSGTEPIILSENQDNDRTNFFSEQPVSIEVGNN